MQDGVAVVDGFLDHGLARRLAREAREHLREFRPHQWIFAGLRLPKPGVHEVDLHEPLAPSILPLFYDFYRTQVPGIVAAVCARVGRAPPPADGAISVKVQYNDGRGGCFPLHHDNPGAPSKRALTIVGYLNDAWEPAHGGEIVFVPFAARRVAVAPTFNRAVIFRSELALHGVRPAWRERLCFTIWVDDPCTNRPEACSLTRSHLRAGAYHDGTAGGLAAFFRRSPLQRTIARAVYLEEMSRDLERCLRAADGLDDARVAAVVRAHEAAARSQRENPELAEAIRLLLEAKRVAQGAAEGGEEELIGAAEPEGLNTSEPLPGAQGPRAWRVRVCGQWH